MLYLTGSKGMLHNLDGVTVESDADPGRPRKLDVPDQDPFANQLQHFADCLLNSKAPLTCGPDARKTLEVCLAGYAAADSGQVVRLPVPVA
jgi:predicted dehydrogenase